MDTGSGPDWGQQMAYEARAWAEEYEASTTDQRTHDTKGPKKMARYASANGGDFKDAPIGTHVARCVRIYDIGSHDSEYQGKVTTRNQIVLAFELPGELMDDGQPFLVHKFMTNSLHEKAVMRAELEAWRGRSFTETELKRFDLETILGKCCLLSVVDKGGKARAGGIMALPKGQQVPPAHNDVWAYWIDEHDEEKFQKVPKGFQKLIMESHERTGKGAKANGTTGSSGGALDDDIPFASYGSCGLWRSL